MAITSKNLSLSEYYRDGSIINNDILGGSIPNSGGERTI